MNQPILPAIGQANPGYPLTTEVWIFSPTGTRVRTCRRSRSPSRTWRISSSRSSPRDPSAPWACANGSEN